MKKEICQKSTTPTDMSSATQTLEQAFKLIGAANELRFTIAAREKELAELGAQLMAIRKQYGDILPRVQGVFSAVDPA